MAFRITSGRQHGFTLIELVVVMAIIALLLTFALPRYFDGLDRAKEAALRQDLKTMRDAIEQFHADRGTYPNTLQDLVANRYLRAVPADPVTESAETWVITPPQEPGQGAVYDIRSGADGQSHDGTAYAEW
jgi:general secretion pathway protein G